MFPVEEKLGEIRLALGRNRDVVLSAPPGSGKTTCVPPALLDEPWLQGRKIVMLEPRRLAARTCAEFIASKIGETVGATVGYQVRLERRIGPHTRLEIVTEGLLTQRLLSDPELKDVGLVIFDEFHERSLACDLSFALALEVRRALRPDLRLLVMSATLDADEVSAHLGDATIVRAEGRMFPVETRYLGEVSIPGAVSRAAKETGGDILCFLPGEGEIRRAAESMADCGLEVLPLYGALPKEAQAAVFAPFSRRKLILATSIAETSVTIPGITCVIDCGLMRVPRFSPSTGMSGLVTLPLTRDRAEQRRGRAGRVQSGVCYRLWTEGEEMHRPPKMTPEIMDADLASLVLSCAAWGATRREDLPWMTPPPASSWDQSVALLRMLGAIDGDSRLTEKGEAMAHMPMHPRLANMIIGTVEAGGDVSTATLLAAIVEEGGRRGETDIRKILDEILEMPNRQYSKRILQLSRRFAPKSAKPGNDGEARVSEGAMLALAYPDRVAKNRGNGTFRMVSGRGAALELSDPLAKAPYIVCCELDDRQGDAKVFLASPIDETDVVELFGDRIEEVPSCEWDRREERVKCTLVRRIGAMTISEKPSQATGDKSRIADCLLDGVRQKGVSNLPCWTNQAWQYRARINFLARHCGWQAATDDAILKSLAGFIDGMRGWRDLERVDMCAVLGCIIADTGHSERELDRLAPTRMLVPSGSHMLIHYDGDEPTVEVRLQECFGLMETPKVAGGLVPVVMTLLSPAQRPVQITKDLAGFWRDGYQLVRKDLRGRYPKHYWPEDPFTAIATRRVRPRGA